MEQFSEKTFSLWSTVAELVLIITIMAFGMRINFRFWVKLDEEKRRRPIGRKGNVIEPIASWFCILQMIYWPFNMLYLWTMSNKVMPIYNNYGLLYYFLYHVGIRFGRFYIACNSLFVALIRYVYIVHYDSAKKWEFNRAGKLFFISSLLIPILIETLNMFTSDLPELQLMSSQEELAYCIATNLNVSSTVIDIPHPTEALKWTMTVLPESIILVLKLISFVLTSIVYSNAAEFVLYLKIFLNIKRYVIIKNSN